MVIDMVKDITHSEWEVMRVVWAKKDVTSHMIIEVLSEKRAWKASTIKTLIGRLVKKGALTTTKSGRKYIYQSNITEDGFVNETLEQFFYNICSKKMGQFIGRLVDQAMLSYDDIALLQDKLVEKEKAAYDCVPCRCVKGQCRCVSTTKNSADS